MSVFIKSMQMPEDCRECRFLNYGFNTGNTWCGVNDVILAKNFKAIEFDGRPDWCPLIELPEHHGDLVDVKEMRWDDHYDSDGNLSKYKIAYSDEMPNAIIEAE